MYDADVAVVGAGVAGSLAATMLGRAGHSVILIEPVHPFPADFRCEKIDHRHADALAKAGVLDEVTPAGRRYDRIWLARQGRLSEVRPLTEYGIDYAALVNRLRDLLPSRVQFRKEKVTGIDHTGAGPVLRLGNGQQVKARLVVAANGLNSSLHDALALERKMESARHSISIGFDVEPVGRATFDFNSLTYYGENPKHRVGYITIFPIGERMRANLFVYRDLHDPWLKQMRLDPVAAINEALPRLTALTGQFRVLTTPRIRPIDLVNTVDCGRPGVVLVGDAYSTACPASGTGAGKAFVDVERLCNVHIPRWLADPSPIGVAQIADFYADPVKAESDRKSREISLFAKRMALGSGFGWSAYRWARYSASAARNTLNTLRAAYEPAITRRWARS